MKNILSLLLFVVCLAQCGGAAGQFETLKYGWDFQKSDSTLFIYKTYSGRYIPWNMAQRLVLSEGVTSANEWKFEDDYYHRFKSVSFPKSLIMVDGPRLYDRKLIKADTVYAPWEMPVYIDYDIFARATYDRRAPVLIVPRGCIDAYKNSDWSKTFAYIGDEKGPNHDWPINMRDWSLSDDGKLFISKDFTWSDHYEVWYTLEDDRLQSIELEEGVTKVGDRAFGDNAYDCVLGYVHSLTLPKSLKEIGKYAFKEIGNKCSDPFEINLPEGLSKIANEAFSGANISSVGFSNNLRSIGSLAFYKCKNLCKETGKLVLPPNIEKIKGGAFAYCQAITHVVLPASVDSVGGEAFGYIIADMDPYNDYQTTYLHDLRIDCYAPNPPEIDGRTTILWGGVLGAIGGEQRRPLRPRRERGEI